MIFHSTHASAQVSACVVLHTAAPVWMRRVCVIARPHRSCAALQLLDRVLVTHTACVNSLKKALEASLDSCKRLCSLNELLIPFGEEQGHICVVQFVL